MRASESEWARGCAVRMICANIFAGIGQQQLERFKEHTHSATSICCYWRVPNYIRAMDLGLFYFTFFIHVPCTIYICSRSLFCCNFHTQIILRLKPKLHWHGQSGHFLLWQIEPNSSGLCGRHFDCATPLAQQTICCWLVLVPRPFYLSSFFMLFLCNLFACGKTNQLSCLPLGKRERVTESNAELHSMAITAPAKEASLVRVSIFRGAGSPCIQGTFMRECFLEIIL